MLFTTAGLRIQMHGVFQVIAALINVSCTFVLVRCPPQLRRQATDNEVLHSINSYQARYFPTAFPWELS
jgi:hypothetical protein